MRTRTGHPRRFAPAYAAFLTAPLAAFAVACGSAAGATGSHGGHVPSHGTGSHERTGPAGRNGPAGGTGSSTGTSGGASCAYLTQPAYLAQARVVFIGTMLPGRTIDGPNGLLVSPARVHVERYIKGSGPRIVTVETAVSHTGNGIGAEGVMAHPGDIWKIYSTSRHQPFQSGVCDGSRMLGGVMGAP